MKVLSINYTDSHGGAAMIARDIFKGCQEIGPDSEFLVKVQYTSESGIHQLPGPSQHRVVRGLSDPRRILNKVLGIENTHYRSIKRWLSKRAESYDLMHLHNLHFDYFGLDDLPYLGNKIPIVLTLHDTWLMSGHCAYSIQCPRWRNGCGKCPDLTLYPAVSRDNTAYNWQKKAKIFSKSHLYLVGPSQWVMDFATQSMLAPAIRLPKVIRNGINLELFNPGNQQAARRYLGLPEDQKIILFVANGIKQNKFKDYATFLETFKWLSEHWKEKKPVLFVGLGEDENLVLKQQGAELKFVPKNSDPKSVAAYYQAADVYFHPARADNFPTTILEAMACGLPVVATEIGGIPEQVLPGETGFLAGFENAEEHGQYTLKLLKDESLRRRFGEAAARIAVEKYDRKLMVANYMEYYKTAYDDWQTQNG